MDNSMMIVVERVWVEVEEGIKGINGNGKNTVKMVKLNKRTSGL